MFDGEARVLNTTIKQVYVYHANFLTVVSELSVFKHNIRHIKHIAYDGCPASDKYEKVL